MLLINQTHVLDPSGGYIQSLESQIRHPVGINEISLLTHMFANAGQVLSKEELMHEVWHKRGIVVESSSLLHSISSCRRGLEDRTAEVIRTERGIGYVFTGEVKEITSLNEANGEKALVQSERTEPVNSSMNRLSGLYRPWLMLKYASVFVAALTIGFASTALAKKLMEVSQFDTQTYQQCWYQPTDGGEKIYYQNATLYQFEELSLMLDEQGRSVSFSNQSGAVNCE